VILHSVVPVDNNKKILEDEKTIKNLNIWMVSSSGVILTKDILVKRNWHGSTRCVFCQHDETIKHLFFHC
jgi:hypothetical protein